MHESFGWGVYGFAHIFGIIAYGVFAIVSLAVIVGLIFLLVRFLLVGTKAAQLYVDRNGSLAPTKIAAAPVSDVPTTVLPDAPADPIADAAVTSTTPAGTTASTVTPPAAAPSTPTATAPTAPKKPTTPRAPRTPKPPTTPTV